MKNTAFSKFRRLAIDGMLVVLFFGLLAMPVSFMGLLGYKSSSNVGVLGQAVQRKLQETKENCTFLKNNPELLGRPSFKTYYVARCAN